MYVSLYEKPLKRNNFSKKQKNYKASLAL